MKFPLAEETDPDDYKLSTSGYADRADQSSKEDLEAKKVSLSILSLEDENEGGSRFEKLWWVEMASTEPLI